MPSWHTRARGQSCCPSGGDSFVGLTGCEELGTMCSAAVPVPKLTWVSLSGTSLSHLHTEWAQTSHGNTLCVTKACLGIAQIHVLCFHIKESPVTTWEN